MDVWMDGWMDGRTQTDGQMELHVHVCHHSVKTFGFDDISILIQL